MLSTGKFYWGTIRKCIVAFGNMFNNIYIDRKDANDETQTTIRVPLAYAPKQKFLARIDQQANPAEDRNVEVILPRMSFELTKIEYDPARKISLIQQNKSLNGTNLANAQYTPTPYNLYINLYVYAKNVDDALQVVEQILPYFNPDFNLVLKAIPDLDIKTDLPIILEGVDFDDSYEGDFTEHRKIVWTLSFKLKANFYGPISKKGIIRKAIANVYKNPELANLYGSYSVTIDPYNAAPTDEYEYVEEFDGFGRDDFYLDPLVVPNFGYWYSILDTNANQYGQGAVYDSTGNIYVSGGNESGAYTALLLKMNSSGNLIWQKSLSNSGTFIYGEGVAIDSQDNIATVAIDYDNTNLSVVKLNAEGNILWQTALDPENADEFEYSSITFDTGANVIVCYSAAYNGYAYYKSNVAKISPTGNVLWQKEFALLPDGYAIASAVRIDSQNNIYVGPYPFAKLTPDGTLVGSAYKMSDADNGYNMGIDSQNNYYILSNSNITGNPCLSKIANAAIIWQKEFDLNLWKPTGIAFDENDNVYISLISENIEPNKNDIVFFKFSSNGNVVWQKTFGSLKVEQTAYWYSQNSLYYKNGKLLQTGFVNTGTNVNGALTIQIPADGSLVCTSTDAQLTNSNYSVVNGSLTLSTASHNFSSANAAIISGNILTVSTSNISPYNKYSLSFDYIKQLPG